MGVTVPEPWLCLSPSHNEILGPLFAFQCPSLHPRHGTMGVTVLELCLCLSLSWQNAGLIVCLSIVFLCIPGTLPWESLYLGHRFACHRHDKMPGWLLALAAGPISPTLDSSAGLLACFHHSCSAQCCSLGPFTGAQPVYDCRFAVLILSPHVLQDFPDDFLEGLCCPLCHGETSCAFILLDGVCSIVTEWNPYPTLLQTWEIRIPVFFQRLTHNQSPFYPGAMLPTASTRQLIIGASVFCI